MVQEMRYFNFAEVDGFEVLLDAGKLSHDPELFIKDGKHLIPITISSGEYENDYGEFMFKELVPDKYKELAYKIMDEISCKKERIGFFLKFTLKPEYEKRLMEAIEENDKAGEYFT